MNKTNIVKILIIALTNVLAVTHFGKSDNKDVKNLNFSISKIQI
ncbi:hypothetical protein ACQ9BO_16635 [Flavobacterium sp. P21]